VSTVPPSTPPPAYPHTAQRYGAYPVLPQPLEFVLMQEMNEQQRLLFMTSYNAQKKDPVAGVLLSFFLGGFGAHRFYMGQTGLGILYLVFFWAVIPHLIALVECFFMPGRVREYNEALAYSLAHQVRAGFPFAPAPIAPPVAAPQRALI